MQTSLIIVSNIIVLSLTIWFAMYVSRKSRSAEGWMVAGRSLPFVAVLLTQFATASGGGMLVAQVGLGYSFGWGVVTYGLFTGGGVLALICLAKWLRSHQFSTLPDIIKTIYGKNRALMTAVTIMAMVVPFGWLCTQLVAFANLFHHLTGVNPVVLTLIFALAGLIFILPGGMTSVAWTDVIFGGLMLVMAVVACIYAVNVADGWQAMVTTAGPERAGWEGFIAPGLLTIALWSMSIMPGTMTNQMYFQRIYAADKLKTVIYSLIGTAILLIATKFYAGIMGMAAYTQNPSLDNPEDAAGLMIAGMPLVLTVLYSTFICSTLISTVTSAVQSVVVNIVEDIYHSYISLDATPGQILRLSRIFSVVVLAVSVVLSLAFPTAITWIVSSYAYAAAGLFCPIFLGFVLRNTNFVNGASGLAGVVLGVAAAATAHISNTTLPYAMYGLVASALGILVVGYFTSNESIQRISTDAEDSQIGSPR